MNILIIGGGGREHALAWKAVQSPLADTVFVAPGNAGTALEPNVENVDIDAVDIPRLVEFARANEVGLTIVGPEQPLVAGIVDAFRTAGLRCFGPSRAAAQLEGSKAFSKDFLARHRIPTAAYGVFSEVKAATDYIRRAGAPIVIKADGLAAGKGVIIAATVPEAIAAVTDMLEGNAFGDAGHRVVVEEFLRGEEASFIVMCDGGHVLPMATSQDHKARDNGDTGPNTGGMGAYSPVTPATPALLERVRREVMTPALEELDRRGARFEGCLYAGIMVAPDGTPNVVEFNCRFGDPETQVVLPLLDGGLCDALLRIAEGKPPGPLAVRDGASVTTVLAARGYPEAPEKGAPISMPDALPDGVTVFHAGTSRDAAGLLRTAGGRVLNVTAVAPNFEEAQARSRAGAEAIAFEGKVWRRDIGWREAARLTRR